MTEAIAHGISPHCPDDEYPWCICGAGMEWVDCWDCGGDGYHDDYENDPLWYTGPDDPDAMEWCDVCQGKGGWWQCIRTMT